MACLMVTNIFTCVFFLFNKTWRVAFTGGIMSFVSKRSPQKTLRYVNYSDSDEEIHCRICHDTKDNEPLVSPCNCKGTVGLVHLTCLQRWLVESSRSRCELCGARFELRRSLHRSAARGLVAWWCVPHALTRPRLRRQSRRRSLRADLLVVGLTALVLSVADAACVMLADFYLSRYAYPLIHDQAPTERAPRPRHRTHARWLPPRDATASPHGNPYARVGFIAQVSGYFTASMLLIMVLLSYSCFVCWAQMALRLQTNIWYFWWQHDITVTIVADPVDKLAYSRSVQFNRRRVSEGGDPGPALPDSPRGVAASASAPALTQAPGDAEESGRGAGGAASPAAVSRVSSATLAASAAADTAADSAVDIVSVSSHPPAPPPPPPPPPGV